MASVRVIASFGVFSIFDGVAEGRAEIQRLSLIRPEIPEVVLDAHDKDADRFEAEGVDELRILREDDEGHRVHQMLTIPRGPVV